MTLEVDGECQNINRKLYRFGRLDIPTLTCGKWYVINPFDLHQFILFFKAFISLAKFKFNFLKLELNRYCPGISLECVRFTVTNFLSEVKTSLGVATLSCLIGRSWKLLATPIYSTRSSTLYLIINMTDATVSWQYTIRKLRVYATNITFPGPFAYKSAWRCLFYLWLIFHRYTEDVLTPFPLLSVFIC